MHSLRKEILGRMMTIEEVYLFKFMDRSCFIHNLVDLVQNMCVTKIHKKDMVVDYWMHPVSCTNLNKVTAILQLI